MELDEICPCDGCEWVVKCGKYELACRVFSSFVLHGTFEENSVKMPTAKLFHKLFKEDDKALKNYLKGLQTGESNDLF